MDTHALVVPAYANALEVLAANGVDVMVADWDEYTPTPTTGPRLPNAMAWILQWLTMQSIRLSGS